MQTIYFGLFCVGIAFIIFWSLRFDDQADFTGQKRDEKFRPSQKSDDEESPSGF